MFHLISHYPDLHRQSLPRIINVWGFPGGGIPLARMHLAPSNCPISYSYTSRKLWSYSFHAFAGLSLVPVAPQLQRPRKLTVSTNTYRISL